MSLFGRAAILGRQATGGVPGALPAAILALSPLSYWTLRGNDADTLTDLGSLGYDLTHVGTMNLNSRAGDDGYSYPVGAVGARLDAVDDIAYEPLNASGLTVGFLFDPISNQAGLGIYICKFQNSGAGTFRIMIETSTGTMRVQTTTTAPGDARRRTVTLASLDGDLATGFTFVIVRFGGAAGDFPAIRVGGSNQTGTTAGSGSATSNSTQPFRLFGHDGTSTTPGSMAHPFVIAGQISDGDCSTLESAATTDGW
jgi:hypothetical protein